jgi:hypothetical protein
MVLGAAHIVELDRLDNELRLAPDFAPALFRRVMECGGTLRSLPQETGSATRLERLIQAGAWTDAVFALIEIEAPSWTIRRLIREDGEWFCSLSRQPNLPAALDDTADGCHEILALALLRALVEAQHRSSVTPPAASTVPQIRPWSGQIVCCDNFT